MKLSATNLRSLKLGPILGFLLLITPAAGAPFPAAAGLPGASQLPFPESGASRHDLTARRWFRLGRGHLAAGDYERARPCLEAAIRCDSRLVGAYKALAKAWKHLGSPDRQLEVLELAIARNPVPAGTNSSGRLLQIEPTLWLYIDLAQAQRWQGEHESAIRTLEASLERDPGFWSASRLLARYHQEVGDAEGADRAIEGAFERLCWPPTGPEADRRRAAAVAAIRELYRELRRRRDGLRYRLD